MPQRMTLQRIAFASVMANVGCNRTRTPVDGGGQSIIPATTSGAESSTCDGVAIRVVDEQGAPLANVDVQAISTQVMRGSIPETTRTSHAEGEVARTGPDGWVSVCPPTIAPPSRGTWGSASSGDTAHSVFDPAYLYLVHKAGWPRVYGSGGTVVIGPSRDVWVKPETRCAPGGYTLFVGSFDSPDNPTVHPPDGTRVRVSGVGPFAYEATLKCCGSSVRTVLDGRRAQDVVPLVSTERPIARPRSIAPARSLSLGGESSCALLGDDTLECWGSNAMDKLGDASGLSQPWPVPVPGLDDVKGFTVGREHACARLGDGSVWCWGSAAQGRLGTGPDRGSAAVPRKVAGLDAVSVSAGLHHTCAVSTGGEVYCWGDNDYGQLGVGDRVNRAEPTRVRGLRGAITVVAGSQHTCALLRDGEARCWGWNGSGQIGAGPVGMDVYRTRPVRLVGPPGFDELALTHRKTCARAGTDVWCWGAGRTRKPTRVAGAPAARAIASGAFVCLLDDQGAVSCDRQETEVFTPIEGMSGVVDLDVGAGHVCALHSDGTISCSGLNDHGQLGTGTCN